MHCFKTHASFGALQKNLNEDTCRPVLLATKMYPSEWQYRVYTDICGIPWRESVKRQWGNRKRQFSGLLDATSSVPLEMRPTLLYSII